MTNEFTAIETHYGAGHGTYTGYILGFLGSVLLTLLSYFLVVHHVLVSSAALYAIILLGIAQLLLQLTCFLHLNTSSRARWNLTAIVFTSFMVLFLVIGTLWIMANLDHNMTDAMAGVNVTPQVLGD